MGGCELRPDGGSSTRWRAYCVSALILTIVGGIAVSAKQTHTSDTSSKVENRTIWDRVFSEDQANRGKSGYVTACGYCHMDDLSGGGGDEPGLSPPGLAGSVFLERWRDASVAELAGTIAATMPFERPKLELETYVDIVAYLLKVNGAQPGDEQLPLDGEILNTIIITESSER